MPMLSNEVSVNFTYSKKDCFKTMIDTLYYFENFEITEQNELTGLIGINVGVTFVGGSWGERITVFLTDMGHDGTQMKITSTSKVPTLFAQSKNYENTHLLLDRFSELIQQCTPLPKEDKSNLIESRLETLAELFSKSLITETEYSQKKSELLSTL